MKQVFLLGGLTALLFSCNSNSNRQVAVNYPETKKDTVVDTYFDTEVVDPYRWLEDDMSEETGNWVKEQNKVTFDYLNEIPYREELKVRLENILLAFQKTVR